MASNTTIPLSGVREAFDRMDAEMAATTSRQLRAVFSQTATGTGDIAHTFSLGSLDVIKYRLVYVRCHFVGGLGTNPFYFSIDHASGSTYDTRLATVAARGQDADLNFMVDSSLNIDPTPWTFQQGDLLRLDWTNPAPTSMVWGLEVGLAPAL